MWFSRSTLMLMFFFEEFNVRHKDWLTYSDGTNWPGEVCYNFSISNDLTQMVNFSTWIPDCDSHSSALWIYFSLLTLVFILQWPSLRWGILIVLLSQSALSFHQALNRMSHFIAYLMTSLADWDGLQDHLKDPLWGDIFKLCASAAASKFWEWFQVGIDVYVPHRKYQVKSH